MNVLAIEEKIEDLDIQILDVEADYEKSLEDYEAFKLTHLDFKGQVYKQMIKEHQSKIKVLGAKLRKLKTSKGKLEDKLYNSDNEYY